MPGKAAFNALMRDSFHKITKSTELTEDESISLLRELFDKGFPINSLFSMTYLLTYHVDSLLSMNFILMSFISLQILFNQIIDVP